VPACDISDVTASDNCGGVTVTCSQGALVGDECGGTITNTYTATDDCGNTAECTQVITVNDTTDPEVDGPDNQYYVLEWGLIDFNVIDAFLNGEISADEISALSPTYFPILTEQGFFWPDAVDNCDLDPELDLVQILIGSDDLECPLVARAIWQFTAIDE